MRFEKHTQKGKMCKDESKMIIIEIQYLELLSDANYQI